MKVGVRTLYGANHAVLGATGGFLAGTYLEAPIGIRILMSAVGTFGGLLPDIDTKSSLLGRHLPHFWHKITPGHRGLTHSLLYCAVVYGILFWLLATIQPWLESAHLSVLTDRPYIPIAVTVGALTHLFADSLTVQGVPFFYPFSKRKIRLLGPLSFKTGSGVEPAVVTMLLSIAVAYVLMPYTGGIVDMINTPTILNVRTDKVIVFAITVVTSAVVFTLYLLSKSTYPKRRSKSKTTRR